MNKYRAITNKEIVEYKITTNSGREATRLKENVNELIKTKTVEHGIPYEYILCSGFL